MLNKFMGSKSKFTILFVILLLGAIVGVIVYQQQSSPKTGFILIQEVYNGFDMKKENEKKFVQVKNARDKILDSLTLEFKILAGKIDSEQQKNQSTIEEFRGKRDEYVQRKKTYEEDNDALSKKYDQEILTQLNQYVKDYGEKNGYTYIFGNDSNGSLMYAKETHNITKEIIRFINDKYKGVE